MNNIRFKMNFSMNKRPVEHMAAKSTPPIIQVNQKISPVHHHKAANVFMTPMIGRIVAVRTGCSSCGKRVA